MLYSASESTTLIAISITFFAVAFICTILRVYVRIRLDRSLLANDATIILAMVSCSVVSNDDMFSDLCTRWHIPYAV